MYSVIMMHFKHSHTYIPIHMIFYKNTYIYNGQTFDNWFINFKYLEELGHI